MQRVCTWIYVSTSNLMLGAEEELTSILSRAEARNHNLELTGVLLYSGHHFAQYLEGPPAGLAVMKRSILADQRHFDVQTLASNSPEMRRYPKWSLGYSGTANYMDRLLGRARAERRPLDLLEAMDTLATTNMLH